MPKEYDPTKPFNEQTRKTIEETWSAGKLWNAGIRWAGKRAVYNQPMGYYIDATDGIGTKALLHWRMYKDKKANLAQAAQDAVAMVFDDFIEQGAIPYRLQDHIIMQEEDERAIYDLTRGLADLCIAHQAVITGGETAICDTMRGFEMGITAVGLTFARQAYGLTIDKTDEELDRALSALLPSGRTVGDDLTEPTTIYCKELLTLLSGHVGKHIHGMVHITGGGWTKLKELDQKKQFDFNVDGRIQSPHEIFKHMHQRSQEMPGVKPLDDASMYKKFNCGTGFVVAVDPSYVEGAIEILRVHEPEVIGSATEGKGSIRIDSAFSDSKIVY